MLSVPVGLRINLAELATDPPAYRLDAGQRSEPITVQVSESSPPPGVTVRVTLRPQGGTTPLPPEELWVESGDGGAAGATRAQDAGGPGRRVVPRRLRARREAARRGRFVYEWTLTAPPWANPSRGTLTLDYQPPRLVAGAAPGPVHMVAGARRDLALPVRLEGLEGENCRVVFRPRPGEPGRERFTSRTGPARGRSTTAIRLDSPDADDVPRLTVGPQGKPGEAVLHLGLSIPKDAADLAVGEYELEGVLAAESDAVRESEPVRLVVVVNALEVSEQPEEGGPWVRLKDPIDLSFYPQRDDSLTLRVATGLHDPLDPARLRVKVIDTLVNDDGDRVFEVPDLLAPGVVAVKGDPGALEFALGFPGVGNPTLRKVYRLRVELRYDELELQRSLEFKVRYHSGRQERGVTAATRVSGRSGRSRWRAPVGRRRGSRRRSRGARPS